MERRELGPAKLPARVVHARRRRDCRRGCGANGSHTVELLSGANVLEVRTLADNGLAGQTYRWVVIAT